MSGRIETVGSHKEESTNKYSKNESFGVRHSGVDIGEDLKPGSSKMAGKNVRSIRNLSGAIGTAGESGDVNNG